MSPIIGVQLVLLVLAVICAVVWVTASKKSDLRRKAGNYTVILAVIAILLAPIAHKG